MMMAIENSNNVDLPVLIYSKIKSNNEIQSFPIGSTLDENEFEISLLNIFPSSSNLFRKIGVILVPTFDWIDLISSANECKDLIRDEESTIKYPSVENGYTILKEYLDEERRFKTDILQKDDLKSGLKLFCDLKKQKFNSYDGLVLTSLDTGVSLSSSRQKRLTAISNETNAEVYKLYGNECATFFSISILNGTNTTELKVNWTESLFTCNSTDKNSTTLEIVFDENEELQSLYFEFHSSSRTWILANSSLKWKNMTELPLIYQGPPSMMETPINYSFACTSAIFNANKVNATGKDRPLFKLIFTHFQIQPFGVNVTKNGTENHYKFGQCNYCSGFFTSGIWMGIISSLLMAFILAFGVYLMTSINTMDRFDDPKGKPLTIAAEK
jgi:V-type H+-transporting ATPase S1 subunit